MEKVTYIGEENATEVYCDENGIHIFHFDDDGAIDWGETLSPVDSDDELPYDAAQDFVAIVIQCMKPTEEGWGCSGYGSVENAAKVYEDFFSGRNPDAASWYYDGTDNSYLRYEDVDDYSDCYAKAFAREFLGDEEQERQTTSKEFESTGEHTYKSADGITYDLTDLDDLYDGFASRLSFSAEKDGKQVEIITNNEGEGLWEERETGSGYDLVQVAGTSQYRLPTTDSGLCRQLRDLWIDCWAERENPDWI